MELINQHTKKIMEGCKERARAAGLRFQDETLEYIVTSKDLLELTPKLMIPTLYDYWVHDVEVIKEKGRYELYPNNPYEIVINTRPVISFYNDNNPDWLNVMIFYHVLGHIDFFQNNMMFKHTWTEDFTGRALSDKRFITKLRSEKGRWVDYVIEFSRGIDNPVNLYDELSDMNAPGKTVLSRRLDFYFDVFLQKTAAVKIHEYLKEIDRYNDTLRRFGDMAESAFFSEIPKRYPEFETLFEKHRKERKAPIKDILQYLQENSPVLQREENKWMASIMEIVRHSSLFFQPQIRTKIMNEGWASYWHEKLFLEDDRINGNEVGFARVHAKVTSLPRVGLNPYALGMRLFDHAAELADRGKLSHHFERIKHAEKRKTYDQATGNGKGFSFQIRENLSDFNFINKFVDQDFIDKHRLFVTGKRLNTKKDVWEYYVKSRKAEDYKQMLLDSLYHPPHIEIDETKAADDSLYLNHHFEEKALVKEFIANTMLGIEYLWGRPVHLETTELFQRQRKTAPPSHFHARLFAIQDQSENTESQWQRVLYTMENKKIRRQVL